MSDVEITPAAAGECIPLHRVQSRFFNQPLLLTPDVGNTIAAFLLDRVAGGGRCSNGDGGKSVQVFRATAADASSVEIHSPRVSAFAGRYVTDERGRPLPFALTAEGAAIITIDGELVNRGAWVGADSGLVSYEGIKHQLAVAVSEDRVKSIVLDLNTPGGEAVGCFECAAAVREAAAKKEVIAIVNGFACSGGYAIASGATRIVSTPSGMSGSIGVLCVHYDFSAALEQEGIKPTLIFAGAHKADGNPFQPLPDGVRDDMQARVSKIYDQFVETVSAGRSKLSAKDIRDTEARVYSGADAVRLGLADSVGTFETVLADISRGSRRNMPSKGNTMDTKDGSAPAAANAGQVTITSVDQLRAAYPALCGQISTDAATAERTRILAIETAMLPGNDKLAADYKADASKSAGDFALAQAAASKATLASVTASLGADETKVAGLKSEQGGPVAPAKFDPRAVATRAQAYIAEQATKGVTVSAVDAVAHVSTEMGVAG